MIESFALLSQTPARGSDARAVNPFIYGLVKIVLFTAYKLFFRVRFYGTENVPATGTSAGLRPTPTEQRGVILAVNHASFLDPPLLGLALKRHVTYLAKEYLFRIFVVGWVLRGVGAYPIKTRSGDFRTLRQLLRILDKGRCVVIFPEGSRSPDGRLREAENGVGFLAVKSQAWVVPVYIDGAAQALPRGARWFRSHPIRVYFGEPFVAPVDSPRSPGGDPYAAVGERIMQAIQKLQEKVHDTRGNSETVYP